LHNLVSKKEGLFLCSLRLQMGEGVLYVDWYEVVAIRFSLSMQKKEKERKWREKKVEKMKRGFFCFFASVHRDRI